jgi:hypothetical protein
MKIQQRGGIFGGKAFATVNPVTQLSPALGTLKMLGLPQSQGAIAATAGAPAAKSSGFSLHDLLSIVNPLQHLPVIGTLYRAITGDTIGTPEKIAGDALYGGLWGAVSCIADAAFEAVTGKDVGDTVLAFFTGNHDSKPVAVASNAPAAASAAQTQPDANYTALATSLARKGVSSDLAQRAMLAYQKSMTLPNTVLAAAQ